MPPAQTETIRYVVEDRKMQRLVLNVQRGEGPSKESLHKKKRLGLSPPKKKKKKVEWHR